MAKAKDQLVLELSVNSAPPVKISDGRRGFVLSKTQAALCAIENSAILESYARADTSSDPRDKREALILAREWHNRISSPLVSETANERKYTRMESREVPRDSAWDSR